ncbi:hypothetical protein MMC16_004895 [Acarospora aff. strigata]|nr:hypothetical protein [Acarospora aff. strigata]
MAAMVDTQSESIDISQLKRIALGYYDSDDDGNRLASSRARSVTDIAQSSLPAAAARSYANAPSTDPSTTAAKAGLNAPTENAYCEHGHLRARFVQSSPCLINHSRLLEADCEKPSTDGVQSKTHVLVRDQDSGSQLPSTIPESTERSLKRKRRMEVYSSLSQGDTQPVSQWVYDEFTNKTKLQQSRNMDVGIQARAPTANEKTSNISGHGESGHIDLLGEFELQANDAAIHDNHRASPGRSASSEVSDLESDIELSPGWKRFQPPKTPATNGKKRNYMGKVISPSTTPALPENPLAELGLMGCGVMGLSQVFKATQAPTSPLIHGLHSDGISERPSPDLCLNHRLPTGGMSSSPIQGQRTEFRRALTEPQTTYVSMKESQARRERALGLCRSSLVHRLPLEEDSEDDFESEESLVRRRRAQRRIDDEAMHQFAGLTAPPRPSSSGRDRGRGIHGRHTQALIQHKGETFRDAHVISDDNTVADDIPYPSEDDTELELEAEPHERVEQDEDDKENINTAGLQVPMTTSIIKISTEPEIGSPQSPSMHRRGTSLPGERRIYANKRCQYPPDPATTCSLASTQNMDAANGGSPLVAVADSQPSQAERKVSVTQRSASSKTPLLPSSLCVPQSQNDLPSRCPLPDPSAVGRLLRGDSSPLPQVPSSSPRQPCRSSSLDNMPPSLPSHATGSSRRVSTEGPTPDRSPVVTLDSVAERSGPPSLRVHHSVDGNAASRLAEPAEIVQGTKKVLRRDTITCIAPQIESRRATSEATPRSKRSDDGLRMMRSVRAEGRTIESTIPETSPSGDCERIKTAKQYSKQTVRSSSEPSQNMSTKAFEHRQLQSNDTSIFETAQTHLTSGDVHTPESRQELAPGRQIVSPKITRLRDFTEVASPTLPDGIGDDHMDISVITSQDIEYQAAIDGSSPVRPSHKRRRGAGMRVLHVSWPGPTTSSPASVISSQEREQAGVKAAANARPIVDLGQDAVQIGRSRLNEQLIDSRRGSGTMKKSLVLTETRTAPDPLGPGKGGQSVTTTSLHHLENQEPAVLPSRPVLSSKVANTAPVTAEIAGRTETALQACAANKTTVTVNVKNPNQILAHFNGRNAAYYPATCIGIQGTDASRFHVRFDDGTVDIVGAYSVKRLELQRGDHIKVDLPSMRKKTYIVVDLEDEIDLTTGSKTPSKAGRPAGPQSAQYLMTDTRGYSTVRVYQKQRDSLPANDSLPESEIISVPVNDIYLTQTMWARFKDRQYTHAGSTHTQHSGLTTPSERPSTPSTASSRSPRNKTFTLIQEGSCTDRKTSGLFANMVFAITYGDNEQEKQRVIRHIKLNSGRVVQDGFHELFHLPHLEPAASTNNEGSNDTPLCLKPDAAQLGFACVIADGHSRRKKHLQALALGLPSLAGRWVEDCVAKDRLLNWEPYLLPAGESAFLGGAVRSRILQPYPAYTARLSVTIDTRPTILSGRSVLLVMGKGKAEESRKAYLFLTYALGASKVSRALDLGAARKMLADSDASGEKWDLVYVDGKKKNAEKVLFGDSERGDTREEGHPDAAELHRTRIVGNEFVVQSLISGTLLEDD